MSPAICDYPARVGVGRTQQSAQRIVKADNENRRADRLQILRHKTHPKLFACANDKNGDEQDDEIAFEPEESSERLQRRHVEVLSNLFDLFKSPRGQKLRRLFISGQRTIVGAPDSSATGQTSMNKIRRIF